jgi:hypothetical protein
MMTKFRNSTKIEYELETAIRENRAAVDKLKKFELRQWTEKIKEQQEVVRQTRERLYNAWDAHRMTLIEDDI